MDILSEYNNNQLNIPNTKAIIELDYAFNKVKSNIEIHEVKPQPEIVNEVIQDVQIVQNTIDINKHWQVYFDNTYQRDFYYNPFTNESVWELPEGAEITTAQAPTLKQHVQEDVERSVGEGSYYDEEAWEEDDLIEKLVYDKMKNQQLAEWMKRPARQQVQDTRRDTAYIEGNYDYNIWFDKYLTDRKEEREKIPALHRCNPALDIGYTKADLQEKEGGAYFCLFFAKGCCSEGVNCKYYHRVPTLEDANKIENLRDVFGRSRFATPRNDMGGIGTFTRECRTIYITDLKMIENPNPMKEMIRILYEQFSPWGEIEDINYIPTKSACYIRYAHRCFAEFGKEAMVDQSLVGEEVLAIKWAYEDPNPMNKNRIDKEHENKFLHAYSKKQKNMEKIKERHNGKPLPNTDYYTYYNNVNNQYSDQMNNCVKLAETLQMIDQNFNQYDNI